MTETPKKYQANTRNYEQKNWLYQKYWGELLSVMEMAKQADVVESHRRITEQMERHGIPRRVDGYTDENSVSPFAGFYQDDIAQTDDVSTQDYDPNFIENSGDPNWMDVARNNPIVSTGD